jgi:hypothetical protein
MKTIRIDNKLQRVFVLRENKNRMIYIPVKSLHRVDYERMKEIEAKKTSDDLLTVMGDVKLSNGINALVQFDNLICVAVIDENSEGHKILKPGEKAIKAISAETNNRGGSGSDANTAAVLEKLTDVLDAVAKTASAKAAEPEKQRKKPGPKPRQKPEEKVQEVLSEDGTEE